MRFLIHIAFFLLATNGYAITLPSIIGDHMVLQQKEVALFWGWGNPLEPVSISPSWTDKVYRDTVTNMGVWKVKVPTPAHGGPFTITIKGYNEILIKDVLVGEVWIASGQSNMEWSVNHKNIIDGEADAAKANYNSIRFFHIQKASSLGPQDDTHGKWEVCTPETMRSFSAVGYFFAQKLHTSTQMPIAVINSSWGGTPAEAWCTKETIQSNSILQKDALALKEVPWGPTKTASIYHAMIHPIINYKIKGALWYQGESNVMHAARYHMLLTALVQDWRSLWGYNFPFYYVQIAPYKGYGSDEGASLRNAQRMASSTLKNAEMVVISDIGNIDDIHPGNKKDVGFRLAAIALNNNYGGVERYTKGPGLLNATATAKGITITMNSSTLMCKGKCLQAFEVSDKSKKFVNAEAVIQGNQIVLSSSVIKKIKYVRFNWCNACDALLTDESNLPASTFMVEVK